MNSRCWLVPLGLMLLLALVACRQQVSLEESGAQFGADTVTSADNAPDTLPAGPEDVGAVAAAPAAPATADATPPGELDWSPVDLASGEARIGCEQDYATLGDGERLEALDREHLEGLLSPCAERGALRLRYDGKIAADFTALVQRVAAVADALEIESRVLDIDSSGGQIEDAIRAGDAIAESGWTIWVREDAICHSSCVLVLAAGDLRMVAGKVGVHRMVRIGSAATSRAELNEELQAIHGQMKDYLQRNGASVAIADLMMTVPNRSLRLVSDDELRLFGLQGRNAAEDDLQRIELARRCGEDFVRRKDAFFRAFENRCTSTQDAVDDMNACGIALRGRFGFPDDRCPADGPLAEHDAGADDGADAGSVGSIGAEAGGRPANAGTPVEPGDDIAQVRAVAKAPPKRAR